MNTAALPRIFSETFKKFSERVAIVSDHSSLTYGQLDKNVNQWINEFASVGMVSGMKILLAVKDPIDFIAVWIALWKLDCILIPLEAALTSAEMNRAIIAGECDCVISDADLDTSEMPYIQINASLVKQSWKYIFIRNKPEKSNGDNLALFFYTSGTTGLPKCVMFSHDAMAANVISLAEAIKLNEKDVFYTPLSPVLPAALATAVLPALATGASLVVSKAAIPGSILKNIITKNVTVFFAVPYLYNLLANTMELRGKDLWGTVRLCLTSSAFLDGRIIESFFNKTRIPIRSIYCSSEAGAITFNNAEQLTLISSSVGAPLPGVAIKTVNTAGEDVTGKENGEVLVKGSNLSKGYYGLPELQKRVFYGEWVKTGDYGFINEAGYLILNGRISETINVSGFLVNPMEVEHILLEHPGISDVLVYGLDNAETGEIVAAKIVQKNESQTLTFDDILMFCSRKLVHYKLPRYIEFVKEISKGRYGKKVRNKIEAMGGKPK